MDCYGVIYREKRALAGKISRPADIPPGHKFCCTCQRLLPLSEWSKRSKCLDGYHFRCKTCSARAQREDHLARAYGLSVADIEEMLARQGGQCVICQAAEAVHVDHDHGTGRVRGILCFRCNAALCGWTRPQQDAS